eukprot:Phypoly_transcript_01559.p1 GENE.Phypoly_transcript_01559~~Phypoly_transcript_01559.p1  ORF type:complete len:683 (+),score=110.62 Phypoly_transcript_01559:158-2206(+)
MECEYSKYGCTTKLANSEHLQLHLQSLASYHLKLVAVLLEKEIEKNKHLTATVENLQSRLAQVEKSKGEVLIDGKVKELEGKLQLLQGLFEKNPYLEVKQNGSAPLEPKDEPIKAVPQKPIEHKGPLSKLDPRFSSQAKSTLERVEEKAKEDRAREEKAREDKLKEDRAREEKAREDKLKEEKAGLAKGREEKIIQEQRGRSKTDEDPRIKADVRGMSATPPPFIVKGSVGDIEPQERRHTSMSLREEPRRSRAKTWSNSSRKKDVESEIIQIPADAPLETGIIWEYDSVTDEWCRGVVTFRMMKNYFAEGALRTAHMMEILGDVLPADGYPIDKTVEKNKIFKTDALPAMGLLGDRYVVKLSKTKVPIDRYFEDVKMQQVCVELAKKFNQQGTPKKVEFLTAWVLEIVKEKGIMWCGLEHYIGGEFKKQSNNHGGVLEPRNTPQAFSHFTWEHTKHNMIVVDLQGVDDDYTDPQVHTKDGIGYGVGNLGRTGIDRFLKTHQCNAICQLLNLPRINTMDTKSAMQKLIKGTQQVPFIDDQLGHGIYPHLDVGEDVAGGEFQCVQTLTGHVDRVVSLCVTPKYLFSGSSDGTLRVWSLPGLTFDRELNVHRKSVESICANEQYLFTGSADHSIKVWDMATFVLVIALRDHVGEVNAIALSDKSLNYLVSASFDKNIKVFFTHQ